MYKNPAIKIALFYVILSLAAIGAIFATGLKPSEAQEATVGNGIEVSVTTYTNAPSADFEVCLAGPDETVCRVLNDGDTHLFDDLDDGRYELYVGDIEDGWQVRSFRCTPTRNAGLLAVVGDEARFRLDGDGDHFVCKYVFERAPTPTPTQTATPAPTSTAVPAPTQPPPTILVACPGTTTLVNLTNGQTCPTNTPAAPTPTAAPVVQQSSTIKPPATGSAGLR